MQKPPSMVDLYFMEARSKLIDIAAFIDRVEKNGEEKDFRFQAFLGAVDKLKNQPRAIAVLDHFSDPSKNPVPKAGNPAIGAWDKPK